MGYIQPGNLFRLMTDHRKTQPFANIAEAVTGVPEDIRKRRIALFAKCDPAYGEGVARALGMDFGAIAAE